MDCREEWLTLLQKECKSDLLVIPMGGWLASSLQQPATGLIVRRDLLLSFCLKPSIMAAGKVCPFSQISTSFLILSYTQSPVSLYSVHITSEVWIRYEGPELRVVEWNYYSNGGHSPSRIPPA